jgi:hypothetical protein
MRKFILNFFVLALFCFSIPLQKAKADANRTLGIIGTALGGTALGLSGLNTLALARRGAFGGGGYGGGFNNGVGFNQFAYGGYGGGFNGGSYGFPPSCCSAPVVNSCCQPPIMPSSCCSPPIQYSYSYMPVTRYVPVTNYVPVAVPVMQAPPPACCGSGPVGCSSSLYGGFYR